MFKRLWPLAITRFLTSFNDNAFKMVAMFVSLKMIAVTGEAEGWTDGQVVSTQGALLSFAAMVFMLPFVIFPTVSGWLADRYTKRKVLMATKIAEIVIMGLGMLSYILIGKWGFAPLLVSVFLMAAQSTFLSPAFYGILPETFSEKEISNANGILQLVNFLGIILGSACGGFSALIPEAYFSNPAAGTGVMIALPFIGIAVIGVVSCMFVRETNSPTSNEKFGIHLLTNYFKDFRYVRITRAIWLCVLGTTFFFAIGSLLMTSLMNYGTHILHLDSETKVSMLIVAVAFGTGLGCFIAGEFSKGRIEFGLVPIGSIGMTVFLIHLVLTTTYHFALINCFALGIFAGFFVLPLTVFVQERAPEAIRGKVLAQLNAVNSIGMLLVAVTMLVLTGGIAGDMADATFFDRVRQNFMTLDTRQLYIGTIVVLILASAYVFWLLPDFLMRLLVLLLAKLIYRIRVFGLDKLPGKGPVMLISNHVSYVDALLLSAACPRSVHFIVSDDVFKHGKWKTFAKWAQLIPMPDDDNADAMKEALARVSELLHDGEVVCAFPEGELTTNGRMQRFRRDFLKLLPDDLDVPIIPVHLGLLWGSIFSLFYGTVRLRRPQHLPYPVNVSFGDPLPRDASPLATRNAVTDLAVEAELQPGFGEHTLAEQFIKLAHRHPFAKLFKDSMGKQMSASKTLITAYAMSSLIRRTTDDEHVGIMLPNNCISAAMCLGAMLADRTPVFLNFTASKESLDFAIENCKMTKIITSHVFVEKAELPVRDDFVYLEDLAKNVSGVTKLGAMGRALLPSAIARRLCFPKHGADVFSTATVLFSSGSTGKPKGIVLTHHNLSSNINALVRMLGLQRKDVVLGSLPFFHSFGFLTGFWLPFTWGTRVVWHNNPLDAEGIGKLCEEHKVSLMFATPTFLQAYTRKCTPDQLKSVRVVITGAEKLSDKVAKCFEDKFGLRPTEGYGATELSPVVSLNMPENILDTGRKVGRPGSIGQALNGINIRIVDPETRETVPEGEEGLLLVKGANVMKGYLNDPNKTAEVMHDGWYITGDMARIDEDAYLYITGRISRFSKIGGEMVPHIAVEQELNKLLDSHELKLAVTSVPHPSKGERLIVLHVPLELEPGDLVAKLRGNGLPNLWIPKPNDFVQVEEIPILGSGKLDLGKLRDLANEHING